MFPKGSITNQSFEGALEACRFCVSYLEGGACASASGLREPSDLYQQVVEARARASFRVSSYLRTERSFREHRPAGSPKDSDPGQDSFRAISWPGERPKKDAASFSMEKVATFPAIY